MFSRPLFVYFRLFKHSRRTRFATCKIFPPFIKSRDSNSKPLNHESPPVAPMPGPILLLIINYYWKIDCSTVLTLELRYDFSMLIGLVTGLPPPTADVFAVSSALAWYNVTLSCLGCGWVVWVNLLMKNKRGIYFAVWPDVEIKSNPIFPNVATSVLTIKLYL